MKIAFIQPYFPTHIAAPPLGLGYLAGYLRSHGHKVELFDCAAKEITTEKLVETLKKEKPNLIGITVSTMFYPQVKETIRKLKKAKTGGRDTVEEQKQKGGIPEECMIFEMYKQHLIENDKELDGVYKACKAGTLLCGKDKENSCAYMEQFMNNLILGMEKARKNIDKLKFVQFR